MHCNKRGFSLMELLTVVLILSILTAIAVPQYRKSIYRAEAANALINLKSLYDSAKRAYAMHSSFPTSFAQLDVKMLSDNANPTDTLNTGGFSFSFEGKGLKGCRQVSSGDSFCLHVAYGSAGSRDVYTCTYTGTKFQFVCESMGTCTQTTCVIE